MSYEIIHTEVPAQKVVAIKASASLSQIGDTIGSAFGELYQLIGQRGIAPAGPPTAVYGDMKRPDEIEVEICVPIAEETPPEGRVIIDELPASRVLRTLHRGPYDDLPEAYEELEQYAAAHHVPLATGMREQYLNGPPAAAPEEYETLIQWPIEKAA